jgi:hypothetical protein
MCSNTSPSTGEPVVITVTLHNTGTAFSTAFWVDLYLSTSPINPQVNQTWDEAFADSLVPYGVAWKVYGMPTDGDFVITNLNPNDLIPGGTCNNYSNFIPNGIGCWPQTWKGIDLNNYFTNSGTYYLYVRVDSLDEVSRTNPNGMVVETNENNNLYSGSPIQIIVGTGGASVPAASSLQTNEVRQPVENNKRSAVMP